MIEIEGALYPDQGTLEALEFLEESIDFLACLCSAWNFGLLPDVEVMKELRKPVWQEPINA